MLVDIAEFNFEVGGLVDGIWGPRRDYDFSRLVEAMDDDWPAVLVLCEGAFYEYNGSAGAFGAASAMREAGGRPYVPLLGTLTGDRGPMAPVVFVDPQVITVHNWFSGREPDHLLHRTNLLVASVAGSDERWRLVAAHWDVNDELARLRDARNLRPYARPDVPCAVVGDFNSHPSGPQWRVDNFDAAPAWRRYTKTHWPPQIREDGTPVDERATEALDFLLGRWHEPTGRRQGGVGFHCAAEHFDDHTPTVNGGAPGTFGPMTLDRVLVNDGFRDRLTDYRVHLPKDPANPPSDHRRITTTLDI